MSIIYISRNFNESLDLKVTPVIAGIYISRNFNESLDQRMVALMGLDLHK